jgi:hypothetical protein
LPPLRAGAPRCVWSFERACGGVRNTLASESARSGKRTKLASVTKEKKATTISEKIKKNHRLKSLLRRMFCGS